MDVTIDVNRTSTTVVVYATSLVMDGLFHRICEFLVKRQRPFHFGCSWGRLVGIAKQASLAPRTDGNIGPLLT